MLEVVVGTGGGKRITTIARALQSAGYIVHAIVPSGWWLLKACEHYEPELALVELNGCGIEMTRILAKELDVAVVVLGGPGGPGPGIRGYIPPDADPRLAPAMVRAAYFGWEQLAQARRQLAELTHWKNLHRPLEKAKGIIMARQGLGPEAAAAYLQQLARTTDISLYELALRICGEGPE